MASLLLRHAAVVVAMDADRREIADGAVALRDDKIAWVGATADLPAAHAAADEVVDLRHHVLLPGLINTHHHMYQSLTRAIPAGQNEDLFGWLRALYPIWTRLTPEGVYVSTLTAMAELLLSGCTTASDHLYIHPNGCRLDDSIAAAREIGMRFHACRGAQSLDESQGGLPPAALVENEDAVLKDMERVIHAFHDPRPGAMLRIALAPCSPYTVTPDLMRETAALARRHHVRLHTHLAEMQMDVTYSRAQFDCTPAEYAERLGWIGADVWHAHCVKLDGPGIALFAGSGTSVAHCPSSNMRLASGIAPVRAMRDAGIAVGLGVDGSASNDCGHMLAEARQAMLLQRATENPKALGAREALEHATLHGARALGRDDIGCLKPGMMADLAAFDLAGLAHAGAWADPVAALLFCAPARAAYTIVNGRVLVRAGQLTTLDEHRHAERHNRAARAMMAI